MKIPITWLKDYIDLPIDLHDLTAKLTSIGHMQDGPFKEVAGDTVIDLEIRQNRSDCLALLGIAREAGAVLNQKINYPEAYKKILPEIKKDTYITIENPDVCYRFNTVTIEGIKIGTSPEWLKKKLEAYGMKSINNLVDITNFVMIEVGQPLHAFDAQDVKNHHIIVRSGKNNEKIIVIGGKEVILTNQDLVIADSEKILAVAGIIGGDACGIKENTNTVILEAATYNQANIRRTALKYAIRTEASLRLEKFLHPKLTEYALIRAAELIQELCGGSIVDHTDEYSHHIEMKPITLHLETVKRIGSVTVSAEDAKTILRKLEIPSEIKDEKTLIVHPPYFRTDVEEEIDVVEEVVRMYGYDTIVDELPQNAPPQEITSKDSILEEQIRDILTACGYDEQITDPLTKEVNPGRPPVLLQNSLNSEKTMLRTTMKHNLLYALENRKKFREEAIYLFELGKIYFQQNGYQEKKMIGMIASAPYLTFSAFKGTLEILFERLEVKFEDSEIKYEEIKGTHSVYFVEIPLSIIQNAKSVETKVLSTPPQLILQDLSILVPENTKVGEILHTIKDTSKYMYTLSLGEEPRILKDGKSLFIHMSFHDENKTLTNEEVETEKERIIKKLNELYSAKVR